MGDGQKSKSVHLVSNIMIFIGLYILIAAFLGFLGLFVGDVLVSAQHLDGPVLLVYLSFPVGLAFAFPIALHITQKVSTKQSKKAL